MPDSIGVSPLQWSWIEYALRARGDSFVVAARFARDERSPATVLEHLLFDADPDAAAAALAGALSAEPAR